MKKVIFLSFLIELWCASYLHFTITNNNGKVDKVLNGRFNKKGALFFYFRKNTYVCNIITIPLWPKIKKVCTQQTL